MLQILGILAAQVLMGLSWLAAYISTISSLSDYSISFIFIHFTMNGILGATILFFHFVLRKDARAAWVLCCAKQKSYASNRRRVSGKGTVNARSHDNKPESDYTLVIDRAGQKETCPPGVAGAQGARQMASCTTNRNEAPDLTSNVNTVRSRTHDESRHCEKHRQNVHTHHDNLPPVCPSYRMLSDNDLSTGPLVQHGTVYRDQRNRADSMYGHCSSNHQSIDYDRHNTLPYDRHKADIALDKHKTMDKHKSSEYDRHNGSPRRSSKTGRNQDGLVNTRV
jgi:hypothetical protein